MTNPSVLVIGGGAFGTSTAYHLSIRGYTRVKVLDRFAAPSKDAAATDLNKIVRYDYPNPLYTRLGLEAMTVWRDPKHLLSGMFRHTGWLMGAHEMTQDFLKSAYESSQKAGLDGVRFMEVSEIKQTWPQFTGDFKGWTNLWSPEAGWVRLHIFFVNFANRPRSRLARHCFGLQMLRKRTASNMFLVTEAGCSSYSTTTVACVLAH